MPKTSIPFPAEQELGACHPTILLLLGNRRLEGSLGFVTGERTLEVLLGRLGSLDSLLTSHMIKHAACVENWHLRRSGWHA